MKRIAVVPLVLLLLGCSEENKCVAHMDEQLEMCLDINPDKSYCQMMHKREVDKCPKE